jgi:RES domain-containing protein
MTPRDKDAFLRSATKVSGMPDPDLVERLDALPRVSRVAVTFRHVSVGRQPLSGEGARIQGGRWNPPESFPTLYLAESQDVMVAEFRRLAVRTGRSPADFLPRELYRIDIALGVLVDLTDPAAVTAVGLSPESMRSDDLGACQAVGLAAHYLGLEGVHAASAAGEGRVIAVFTDRVRPSSRLTATLEGLWLDSPH